MKFDVDTFNSHDKEFSIVDWLFILGNVRRLCIMHIMLMKINGGNVR
jgi:hypothetical protein